MNEGGPQNGYTVDFLNLNREINVIFITYTVSFFEKVKTILVLRR